LTAVNQFTVIENQHNGRPDIVVFINALPLAVIEVKNAADEDADDLGCLCPVANLQGRNPLAAALQYRPGGIGRPPGAGRSLTANQEWFKVWRTVDGRGDAPRSSLELEVLIRGIFDRRRRLDLLRDFIAFEEDPDREPCTSSWPVITSSMR
jgi:type I restriction enzyme, R subunit